MPHDYTATTAEAVRAARRRGPGRGRGADRARRGQRRRALLRRDHATDRAGRRGRHRGLRAVGLHELRPPAGRCPRRGPGGRGADRQVERGAPLPRGPVPRREGLLRDAEAAALEGEQKRLLEFWMRDFRRAGHALPPGEKAELESLRNRLVELEVAFAPQHQRGPGGDRGHARGAGRPPRRATSSDSSPAPSRAPARSASRGRSWSPSWRRRMTDRCARSSSAATGHRP